MSIFERIVRGRPPMRTSTTVLAVLALLVTVGGVAWAAPGLVKARGFQYTGTYRVTVELDAADRVVQWPSVGQVDLKSICMATSEGGIGMGGAPLAINNNGPGKVGIAYSSTVQAPEGTDPLPGTSGGFTWLAPNPPPEESYFIEGPDEKVSIDRPNGEGGIITFGIVDEDGTSVTGSMVWSYSFDYETNVGHGVFSLQMRG